MIYPEKNMVQKDTRTQVFSPVYNSQDMEATQVSINRWYFVGRDKSRGKDQHIYTTYYI